MNQSSAWIDLRSDTVTLPVPEMRLAMANAAVGDDVMGEDPTILELEACSAELFRKESALFVPSGTMANQIAVRVYGKPGDEILVVDQSHVFFYEAGSAAGLSGVQLYPVPAENGIFEVEAFVRRIRPVDIHFPRTCLCWVENTHNRGGGRIVPYDRMEALRKTVSGIHRIPIHVDGARLVNAAAATGIPLWKWAQQCDSLSICLSKGLGAPVGSLLIGSHAFIYEGRRARKALGGGMRQAGIIAAGGLYALKHQFDRLAEDHRRARLLAQGINLIQGLSASEPDTNIVMIDISPDVPVSAAQLQRELQKWKIKIFDTAPRRLRAVLHLGITDADIDRALSGFQAALRPVS